MMKKFTLATICLIFIIFISACDNDKLENISNNSQEKETVENGYLDPTVSFDIKASHMDENFKGHNIEEVGKFVVEKDYLLRLPKKDEFETTEEYRKRVKEINPEKILFNTTIGEHYFAFSIDRYDAIKYNADNNELEVTVDIANSSFSKTIILKSEIIAYTNGLGQSMDVKYTDEVEYILNLYHTEFSKNLFNQTKRFIHKDKLPYLAITPKWVFYDPIRKINTTSDLDFTRSFKFPIEKAKKIKPYLKILFVTTLQSPYILQFKDTVKPEMDYPRAGERLQNKIFAQIEQIWIYNSSNGNIIEKWPKQSK